MARKARRFAAPAALAVVLAIKLSVVAVVGEHPLLAPGGDLDDAYYLRLATAVASGDLWLEDPRSFLGQPAPPFFLSPLYIYFLAACLTIGDGSLYFVRVVQAVLGTAAVGLIAATAHIWFGRRAAWVSGAMAAAFGVLTFYEMQILQAAIDPVLSAAAVYALARAAQATRRPIAAWSIAGAVIGLQCLNRPNMLIVLGGLFIVVVALRRRAVPHVTWRACAAFLVSGIVAIAPATLRNYRVTGEFVLISSHGGLNFLIGNGPEADGTYRRVLTIEPTVRGQWIDAPRVAAELAGRPLSSSGMSGVFLRRALQWMADQPALAAGLLARKAWYALSSTFLTLNHSYPFFVDDLLTPLSFLRIEPWFVVPLGMFGLIAVRPRSYAYLVWAAYVPLAVIAVVVFFVAARYRLPYQTALCVPAGAAVVWLVDRARAGDWRRLAYSALSLAALAAVVIWPTGLDDGRAEERTRMALVEIDAGRFTEGESWLERALIDHPAPGIVHLRAGQMYEARGVAASALKHYEQAKAADPAEPTVGFVIGRTLFSDGRYADAIPELERGRRGDQADAATRLLVLALARAGRHEEANARVRELDPDRWTADQAREFGVALAQAGRPDLSIAPLRRAAAVSGDGRDYDRLGLMWAMVRRYPEAIAAFSEAVRRSPRSAAIRLNYAVAFASVGRTEDARREARHALEIDPNYSRAAEFLKSLK